MFRPTLALALSAAVAIGCVVGTALARTGEADDRPRHRLFTSAIANGAQVWRLDDDALDAIGHIGGALVIEQVPLAGGAQVDLEMRRFSVTTPRTQFVIGQRGGADRPLDFDPSRITLLRGSIVDRPGSHAFMALTQGRVYGTIDLGPGRDRTVLSGAIDAANAAVTVDVADHPLGPPLEVDVCGVGPAPIGGPASDGGPATGGLPSPGVKRVQLAVETDYEYFQLHGDADAAAEYVVILYGAVSDIYVRDAKAHFDLNYVRLWEDENDLFNEPDPLNPLRQYWNANMTNVQRDVTQLLTGRRDLPYGGVAWVSALCGDYGYSVSGYILGSFTSPSSPSFGNWDLIVCAHELGHNCGTLHTHDYGIDFCASGAVQRGTIMSYCHTNAGGNANVDLRFHTEIQIVLKDYMGNNPCLVLDCNGDGIDDHLPWNPDDTLADDNENGVLDLCEDCNGNGVLDPDEIASEMAVDLDGNGVPDECEPDCNANGAPDALDIALGVSEDLYGNGVPDECESDCNANGTADYNEIQADMSLDVDRDVVLDSCQDCDGNAINDFDEIAGGLNLWVAGATLDHLREFHGASGVQVKSSASFVGTIQDVIVSPQGHLLATASSSNAVLEFDPATGASLGQFVTSASGGLLDPTGMVFGADGDLYVASRGTNAIMKYDGATGDYIETFAGGGGFGPPGSGMPLGPFGVTFGTNGNLFVTTTEGVREYDAASGDHVGLLVANGSGGLNDPRGLAFTEDGRLLVASFGTDAVLEYDGASGAFIRQFDQGGLDSGFWALHQPWCIRIGSDGRVHVSSNTGNAAIHTYHGQTGQFMRSYYVLAAVVGNATGFDLMPPSPIDCNHNLRPDACDVADGTSADVNGNGLPDECEGTVLPCAADVAGNDGQVDVTDLIALLAAWGTSDPTYDIAPPGGDGTVAVQDLLMLLANWGPCE